MKNRIFPLASRLTALALVLLLCAAGLPVRAYAANAWSAGDLTAGESTSDWAAIAGSRSGTFTGADDYLKALEKYVTRAYREEGGLHRIKATEWQRIALTVLALGGDPTAFGTDREGDPVNLVADGTYNFTAADSPGAQGLNGWIFSLITLDSGRFAVPADARFTRTAMLQALLSAQNTDGSFGLTTGSSDVDLTAMTLQALAPYQNSTVHYQTSGGESVTVGQGIARGLQWLSDQQTAEGDFTSWGSTNSESTAQVIIALCSLGIDPAADNRFAKNSVTAEDALLRYQTADGSFCHTLSSQPDLMATEQATLALEAMERLRGGQRSVYDFRTDMDEDTRRRITELNDSLAGSSQWTAEQAAALYEAYLAIPAAERSYVYHAGTLLVQAEELGVSVSAEDPTQFYDLRPAAEAAAGHGGAAVWICVGAVVAALAAGGIIWNKRRKVCTK